MKNVILSGLLALGLALASEQQAKAWHNIKFSAGINFQSQGADNNFLWGAFRGGPVGCNPYGGGYGPVPFGPPPGATFPYFGAAPGMVPPPAAAGAPAAPAATTPTVNTQPTGWYGGNPYHTVGYNPSLPSYSYGVGNYYYPTYTPYHYAPSYWYGR